MEPPALWKLTPAAVTKPWGLVHREAFELTGIPAGVGELWLGSAQTGPGNYSNIVAQPPLRRTLADLLAEAQEAGGHALERLLGSAGLDYARRNPHRGKTEAWHVRAATGRVGVAGGPRTPEDAARLQEIITREGLPPRPDLWSEEVRELFGIIEPLGSGEMFLVPAGTLHTMFAVGADSVLVIDEVQQGYGRALLPTLTKMLMVQDDVLSVQVHPCDRTVADVAEGRLRVDQDLMANPTVRVYDFGRRPGEYPELGFRLVDPAAGLRRVTPVEVEAGGGVRVRAMVACEHFARFERMLTAGASGDLTPFFNCYHLLHCMRGTATVTAGGTTMPLARGETVLVPGCLEREAEVRAVEHCTLSDDTVPARGEIEEYLSARGATAEDIRSFFDPPPAR